jgi:hypothetical protein
MRYVPTPVPQDENQPLRQWLDDNNRRIEASQEPEFLEGFALLFDTADDVAATNVLPTEIVNYTDSFSAGILVADPVLGTITFPNKAGLVTFTNWITIDQVTSTRDFTVQLWIEINGVWAMAAAAYIPQNAQDVAVGMSATLTRAAAGGEVVRYGLLLDGAASATFQVIDSSFQIQYVADRG